MDTFKIYLAGGMGNLTWEEQTSWRKSITDILMKCKDCYKYKLDIINPVDYYNFEYKYHDSELEIMKFDLRLVKSSDLIIVNFNDPSSIGTAQELAIAYDRDIPIIGINEGDTEIHPWLESNVDKMFNSFSNCWAYIVDFYLT